MAEKKSPKDDLVLSSRAGDIAAVEALLAAGKPVVSRADPSVFVSSHLSHKNGGRSPCRRIPDRSDTRTPCHARPALLSVLSVCVLQDFPDEFGDTALISASEAGSVPVLKACVASHGFGSPLVFLTEAIPCALAVLSSAPTRQRRGSEPTEQDRQHCAASGA